MVLFFLIQLYLVIQRTKLRTQVITEYVTRKKFV